jgi:conjugative transfer signal peptidase TraF
MFMLALAFAVAFLATLAIATAAFARLPISRALRVVAVLVAIVLLDRAIIVSGLRFNVTSSMPLGIYRLAPISRARSLRGMLVAACAPLNAAQLGRRRGYLSPGDCAGDAEPLLKTVVAIAGDNVSTSESGIAVDGRLLPDSKPISLDSAGRPLAAWPSGRYRLRRDQVWLYANNERSWDSRYWGPATVRNVLAKIIPLLTDTRLLCEPSWSLCHLRRTCSFGG